MTYVPDIGKTKTIKSIKVIHAPLVEPENEILETLE